MKSALLKMAALPAAMLLAGCFTSSGSLYAGMKPLRPFADGQMLTTVDKGKVSQTHAHEISPGAYSFDDDPGASHDACNLVRFHALPGAAADTLITEAPLCSKNAGKERVTAKTPRYYGLLRRTPKGWESVNPDCPKDSVFTKLPGVRHDAKNEDDCNFARRDSLEQALLMVAKMPMAGTQ